MREETIDIGALELDCGVTLPAVQQRVTIDGAAPLPDGSNVVFAAHALTGSSRVTEWWPDIVGEGALFDRRYWCVIGINVLGGCYGSSHGEVRAARASNRVRISVADMVRAQIKVFDRLEIPRLAVVVGGSLGGMQALQWAMDAPERVAHAIIIGASDHHTAMGIALNAVQREAIALGPVLGVALARKIAMLSYKSEDLLRERHDRRPDRKGRARFDVEGYLDHQGDKFIERMDGETYTCSPTRWTASTFAIALRPQASILRSSAFHPIGFFARKRFAPRQNVCTRAISNSTAITATTHSSPNPSTCARSSPLLSSRA